MSGHSTIINELKTLQSGPAVGFALAFHIDYTRPTFLFQTYPEAWIREYSEKGLVMSDPTVHWGFEHEGTARWSDLVEQDNAGVLKLAANHGLNYGVTCAVEAGNTRSMCSFARADSEFTDAECDTLRASVARLHDATAGMTVLPEDLMAPLTASGVRISQPGGK